MMRKRLAVVVAAVVMALQAAVPVEAASSPSATAPVRVDGPSEITAGEKIVLTITAEGCDGASADVHVEGLRFENVSSSLCAPYGMVLLPSMGSASVVYTYTVTAAPGAEVVFRLENLEVTQGTGSSADAAKDWRGVVSAAGCSEIDAAQQSSAQTAETSDAASGAMLDRADSVLIRGPLDAFASDTVQLEIALTGTQGVRGEIRTTGLSFISVSGGLSSGRNADLLAMPGLDAAVYTYRVTGPPGTRASFGIDGQAACWTRNVTWPQIRAKDPDICVSGTEADSWDERRITYDLAQTSRPVTAGSLPQLLDYPKAWSVEVYSGADWHRRSGRELLATGDMLVFRNEEQSYVLRGQLVLRGDVASRGRLDVGQLTALARLLSAGALPPTVLFAGDLNASGEIDIDDLVRLARCLAPAVASER